MVTLRSFFYQRTPNSRDTLEYSPMEIDGEEEDEKDYWGFPQLMNTEPDSQWNSLSVYREDHSLKNTVSDYKNKGVYAPSCHLTPLHSDKINTSCCITGNGEPSTRFCVICNDLKPPRDMPQVGNCNHYFCIDCVKEYLIKSLNESGLPVECPEKDCKMNLPDYFLKFIPQEMLDRYYISQHEAKVLACLNYIICPFNDCGSRFVNDMKNYMIRACPKCWKIFCLDCRVEWHMGISCKQFVRNKTKSKCDELIKHYFGRFGSATDITNAIKQFNIIGHDVEYID